MKKREILNINCQIEGISPLLVHACPVNVGERERQANTGEALEPREVALLHTYRSSSGSFYFPGSNLLRAFVDAGTFHKIGKAKVSTQRSSMVPPAVWIHEEELKLEPQEWEVDSRPVVIPSTGGRITRHRARWDLWQLSFGLSIDLELMSQALVRQIVTDAGRRIGIGDFRPARRGSFGRFEVSLWKEVGSEVK